MSRQVPSRHRVIGHRGAAGHAPENTLASLRRAAELGTRCVEVDVKLTRDHVPILMHDDLLERTTDGAGAVSAVTWADVQRLDAGTWFGPAFPGEPVPSLAQALKCIEALHLDLILELKPCPGRERETGEVVGAALRGCAVRCTISSFSGDALDGARRVAPEVPRALLVVEPPADVGRLLLRHGCQELHAAEEHLSAGIVAALTASGSPLLAYTVNDPQRARELWAAGVTAVFSDWPDHLGS